MNKKILAILLALIIISLQPNFVSAEKQQGKLTANFMESRSFAIGTISLGINYEINYSVDYKAEVAKGDTNDINLSLYGGVANLTFGFQNKTFKYNRTMKLGEQVAFYMGPLRLNILLKAEAPINILGSASSQSSMVTFENEGQQTIKVKVSDSANVGDLIKISLPFSLRIFMAITAPVSISFFELGKVNLFPELSLQFKVISSWFESNFYLILALVIAVIIIAALAILFIMRRRKKT
jgi:hypothetical protein